MGTDAHSATRIWAFPSQTNASSSSNEQDTFARGAKHSTTERGAERFTPSRTVSISDSSSAHHRRAPKREQRKVVQENQSSQYLHASFRKAKPLLDNSRQLTDAAPLLTQNVLSSESRNKTNALVMTVKVIWVFILQHATLCSTVTAMLQRSRYSILLYNVKTCIYPFHARKRSTRSQACRGPESGCGVVSHYKLQLAPGWGLESLTLGVHNGKVRSFVFFKQQCIEVVLIHQECPSPGIKCSPW